MNGEKPLVWYSVRAALDATLIDEVWVNSESDEIGEIATGLGARYYKREESLAGDHISSDEFNYDFMKHVDSDVVVMVNPVAPLITPAEIDEMIRHYLEKQLDTLIPVKEERLHAFCEQGAIGFDPAKPVASLCGATPINFDGGSKLPRTQDIAPVKVCVWTVCIWRRETFMRAYEATGAGVFSGKVDLYPQHPATAIKVSDEVDFRIAETLMRYDYMWRYPPVPYDSEAVGMDQPAMWLSEIAYIEKLLLEEAVKKERLTIIEWGSGNSTRHFANHLKKNGVQFKWHAIENFVPWFARVEEMISESGLGDVVELHLKSRTFEDRKSRQEESDMTEFIEFPKAIEGPIDIAIVDARRRGECLKAAAEVLEPDGVAILHDAERPAIHWAFDYFRNRGDFVIENSSPVPGGTQKLWVGRPV